MTESAVTQTGATLASVKQTPAPDVHASTNVPGLCIAAAGVAADASGARRSDPYHMGGTRIVGSVTTKASRWACVNSGRVAHRENTQGLARHTSDGVGTLEVVHEFDPLAIKELTTDFNVKLTKTDN